MKNTIISILVFVNVSSISFADEENVFPQKTENEGYHISELSRDAQNIVMEQLLSLAKAAPFDELKQPALTDRDRDKIFIEIECRRQYQQGYVDGWRQNLQQSDISSIVEMLLGENIEMTQLPNGVIVGKNMKIHSGVTVFGAGFAILTPNDKYYRNGYSDGSATMEQLLTQARTLTIKTMAQWGKKNTTRMLDGKKVDDKEKKVRIKTVPELEALLYLHEKMR